MLKIKAGLLEQMQQLAESHHPIEACGIIAAPVGGNVANHLIPMHNAACSTRYFRFDAKQQLQVWRRLEQDNAQCWVIYHSHTDSIAYPSKEDIRFAADPSLHYVIISTQPGKGQDIRSFRIINDQVTEEKIVVINE